MGLPRRHILSLENCPELVQAGLCLHGAKAIESHCQRNLWSLHAYHYAGCLQFGGMTHRFSPGWVSLIPPGTEVAWSFPQHAPHHYVHFQASEARNGPPMLLRDLGLLSIGFCARIEEMIVFFTQAPRRASVRLWDLLFELTEPPPPAAPPPGIHPHLQIALSLIRNQPSEKLLVAALARRVGVSHNHLTRLFQRQYGCGTRAYIRRERVHRACELLRQTDLQVKSVAIECGFTDLQSFNKTIRLATGAAPTAYRSASRHSGSEAAGHPHDPCPTETRPSPR